MLGGHEFKSKEEGKPLETEISFHWLTSRASRPFSNKRKLRVLCVHWELLEMGHYFEVLQGNDPWIMMILLISYSSNYINYCVKIEFTKYRLEECLLLKNEGGHNAETFFIIHWIFWKYYHFFFLYQLAVFIYIWHDLAASFVPLLNNLFPCCKTSFKGVTPSFIAFTTKCTWNRGEKKKKCKLISRPGCNLIAVDSVL